MNQLWNSRSLRFNLCAIRSGYLALALALCGAGGLSPVAASADVVVWDTGPFCADCVTTNITFVSLEQFDSFTNYVAVRIFDAYGSLDWVTNYIALCESDLWRADASLQSALDSSSNVPFLTVLRIREARFAITNSADTTGLNVGAIGRLNKATEYATRASSDLEQVGGAFYNGVDTTRAQVATACESSGGCVCECPDYTSILNSINSNLGAIRTDVTNISGAIETIYYWLCDIYGDGTGIGLIPVIFNTFDALASYLPTDSDVMNVPYVLAEYGGTIISNRFALVEGLNNWYTRNNANIWNRYLNPSALYGTDGISREIAEVTTFFRQLYSPESPPADFENSVILGQRDFWTSRNVHPTNTADNALWVRGSGTNGSISVSGKVDFDESALRDLLSDIEFKVVNGLSEFHVIVDNTNDFHFADSTDRIYSEVQNNFTTIENIADDVRGQAATYDEPDWTLDDYSTMIDFRQDVEQWDLIGKWSEMFDEVEINEPGPIMIFDSYAPGPGGQGGNTGTPGPWAGWTNYLVVDPLYWYPMQGTTGTIIRRIRDVFRLLWTIVFLVVLVSLLKINWLLVRCGVRILISVFAVFSSPDPIGALVEVFDTTLKALAQLYAGLLGGQSAEETA